MYVFLKDTAKISTFCCARKHFSIAETIAGKLGASAVDVSSIDEAAISDHDNLILGTSTWGAGELQDDWYDGINLLKSDRKSDV